MKTKYDLTYTRVILYGLATEMFMIVVQFIYMTFYLKISSDTVFAFTSDYMKSQGFYIFQVAGFFVYATVAFVLNSRFHIGSMKKLMAFIIAGGVVELSFYLLMQAGYEGAFLYSILDKVVATVFGSIVYYYTRRPGEEPSVDEV